MDDPQLAQEARAPPVIGPVQSRERLPVAGGRLRVVAGKAVNIRDAFARTHDRRRIASAVFQRGPKVRQRLVDGVEALGTLPRSEQSSRRLYVVTAAFEVIGTDFEVLVGPLGEEAPDGV